jgi:signal transduction histidine kinase
MIQGLSRLLAPARSEPAQQARRVVAVQLHVVLPAKAGVIAVVLYYLFNWGWFAETPSVHSVALDTLQSYFPVYILANVAVGVIFILSRRFPAGLFQWLAFTLGLLDGLFMAGLTFITGGFDSITYWIFPALIVLNAISIPLATPQIVLNFLLSFFYLSAGILEENIPMPVFLSPPPNIFRSPDSAGSTNRLNHANAVVAVENTNSFSRSNHPPWMGGLPYSTATDENTSNTLFPRLFVLWLLTACCYGVQLLLERQRQALAEARESAVREGQLHSAGRLAAEFAHQIKNPLAVIANAAFSLQRAGRESKNDVAQQIEIIQEEVARADKVVTQIMGYAQLSEGRVEKLNVAEELDHAIAQVFPSAVPTNIRIHREYNRDLPPLLMQRGHLSEILVNLLQNAREALNDQGNVFIAAHSNLDEDVEISVRDDGIGVPADKIERIFEAYYTTKARGTGLGLAIVKHNAELYEGRVRVKSQPGRGATFTLLFPAKTLMKLES